jgi:hypothetical protein
MTIVIRGFSWATLSAGNEQMLHAATNIFAAIPRVFSKSSSPHRAWR